MTETMRQRNARHDDGSNKYVVGQALRFLGYSDSTHAGTFSPGELLEVAPCNGCGMGIDVISMAGRSVTDMVWPDEVEVVP